MSYKYAVLIINSIIKLNLIMQSQFNNLKKIKISNNKHFLLFKINRE